MKPLQPLLLALSAVLALGTAGWSRAQDTTTPPATPSTPTPPPAAEPAPAVPPPPTEPVTALPSAPASDGSAPVQRRSTVKLPFDAPAQARAVVIAQAMPGGAEYLPGSSTLNGQAIADPKRGPSGTLYWVIPQPANAPGLPFGGLLSYTLTHSGPLAALPAPALLARLDGNRTELLKGELNPADLGAATDVNVAAPPSENPGAIKFPIAGSDILLRDRVNVVIEAPLGQTPPLSVNGQDVPVSQIGEVSTDAGRGVTRVTYVGVPLQVGPNTLTSGADSIRLQRVGGTARIEITPLNLIADGSSPLRLKFRTLDAFGKPTAQALITLHSNLEPLTPDASPGEADYQLKLQNGEGILELLPQASPTTLTLNVQQGQDIQTSTFEVKPDQGRVGVGLFSVTLGLNGDFRPEEDLTWHARASYEGPLDDGKLYLAADSDGLPTDRDTLKRFNIYGDSSVESVPLQGIDPLAMRYDHPNFRVQYSRNPMPIDVLPLGEQFTALSAYSKSNPQLSGFVALVPQGRISDERLTPDGTRVLHLAHGGVAPGSETLEVVTLERLPGTNTLTGKELERVTLVRNVDYQLDHASGVVTLARALDPVDGALNPVIVLASYRLDDPLSQRQLAFGVQLRHTGANYMLGAAVVSLDSRVTYGVRATYDDGKYRADGLLEYSGGVQASADLSAKLNGGNVQASLRYRDAAYVGLAPFNVGLVANASYQGRLTDRLGATVQAEYQNTPTRQGGSVSARADYRADAMSPFSVGLGAKYAFGDTGGLGVILSAGYHRQPLDVDIVHTQPLWGDLGGNLDPTTSVALRYALNDKVTLGLTDNINWNTGQTAALTLDSRLGNTNYQFAYDLPNSGGQGNRARFGVTTTLGIAENLTAGLHGSALYDLNTANYEFGVGGDLRYQTAQVAAALGSDVVYSSSKGFGVVVRGGVSGSVNDRLSLSADGLLEFGAGRDGQRLAVGYAYRDRQFNSLGTLRYMNGTLAGGQPELTAHLSAEYRHYGVQFWAVRAGLDSRTLLLDPDSFTLQAGLGGMWYVTDRLGLGLWGHLLSVPASQTTQTGFGVEASLRALPGTWFTLGFNPVGFSGIGSAYTKPGFYLRLDLTLDELSGGKK